MKYNNFLHITWINFGKYRNSGYFFKYQFIQVILILIFDWLPWQPYCCHGLCADIYVSLARIYPLEAFIQVMCWIVVDYKGMPQPVSGCIQWMKFCMKMWQFLQRTWHFYRRGQSLWWWSPKNACHNFDR